MQKNSTKASILIWAIFISLIISVSFIQISTKINKNLKNNEKIINSLNSYNEIDNNINEAIINNSYQNKVLENWSKLLFDYSNDITFSIWEKINHLSKINTWSIVRIIILEWWPIKYTNNSSSWIINSSRNIAVTQWDLLIYNLWWYTKINIKSNKNENNLSQYMNYKVTKKIWNKEIIITKWKIKSF